MMTTKIKALGLAFVAVAGMSVVAAGSAQAVSSLDVGTAGAGNATITGHIETGQEHILTIGAGFNLRCTSATLEATTAQGTGIQEITATATYSGCQFLTKATVQMNGCKYTLTSTATALTSNVDITCPTGKPITITSLICTIDIPAQNGLAAVTAKNEASNHITLAANVTGIEATQTGAGCPNGNNHTTKTASFTGNTTLTAFNDTGTEVVTEHGHQFTKSKHASVPLGFLAT